ncbi:proteinase-activated receptor 3 isoform X1 [Tachysurus fulvidraco]|uniref:proteinase-activated receptor 3 isoform X1 n=1 Tax=Tachysurus fulvidraco TaxID=1234273 RepID=UPI000F5135EA|nr:proteinase-activated receptor 3 isoform X1 [Tachysurus fulvidraco]
MPGLLVETNMWRLLLILLCTFVLVNSSHLHHRQNCSRVPKDIIGPRTFYGKKAISTNFTLDLPELNISDNHVKHTAGFVSTRIIPVAYVIAIVIGIPSNTLVLAFLCRKTGSLSSAILYLSLAASDLLLLVSLTLKVHYHLNGNNWVYGELACKLVTACFYGNMYCCIYTHMCVSMLRYLAVVHPFLYRGLSKRSCTTWASLTVWIVFALAMVPEFLTHQSYYLTQVGIVTCHDILPYDEKLYSFLIPYRLCLIFLGFIFPFAVIILAYGSIVHQLRQSSCDFTNYIKASTLVFGIFLVCFTPSNTIHLIHYVRLYTSNQDDFYKYFSVAVCICCFHSCLDPFLSYFITKSTNSREKFISLERASLGSSVTTH